MLLYPPFILHLCNHQNCRFLDYVNCTQQSINMGLYHKLHNCFKTVFSITTKVIRYTVMRHMIVFLQLPPDISRHHYLLLKSNASANLVKHANHSAFIQQIPFPVKPLIHPYPFVVWNNNICNNYNQHILCISPVCTLITISA